MSRFLLGLGLGLLTADLRMACTGQSGQAAKTAGTDLSVCILLTATADVAKGLKPSDIVTDVAISCRASELEVARLLEAHAAAATAISPAIVRAMIDESRAAAQDGGQAP
jgi:hypothetical protein